MEHCASAWRVFEGRGLGQRATYERTQTGAEATDENEGCSQRQQRSPAVLELRACSPFILREVTIVDWWKTKCQKGASCTPPSRISKKRSLVMGATRNGLRK